MQNGHRTKQEEQLDDALEDTFPGSDPVAANQPHAREGAPQQHAQSAKQAIKDTKDTANVVKNRAGKVKPDWLWLSGAFVAGCIVGIGLGAAPSAFARPSAAGRMQRRLSRRVSDLKLQKKLSELLDRLQ